MYLDQCSLVLALGVGSRIEVVGESFVVADPDLSSGIGILAGPSADFPSLEHIASYFDPNNIGIVHLGRWGCMYPLVDHFGATFAAVLGSCCSNPGSPRNRYPMSTVHSTWLQFLEDRVAGLDSF